MESQCPGVFLLVTKAGKKKADRSTHSTCQDISWFFEWEHAVYEEIKVQLNFCMPSMQASPVLKHSVDLDGGLKRKDNPSHPFIRLSKSTIHYRNGTLYPKYHHHHHDLHPPTSVKSVDRPPPQAIHRSLARSHQPSIAQSGSN